MKNLMLGLCALFLALFVSGCASMMVPKNAELFSGHLQAEELTIIGATPWGNQQISAKGVIITSDAVGVGRPSGQALVLEPAPDAAAPEVPAPAPAPAPAAAVPVTPAPAVAAPTPLLPAPTEPDPAPPAPVTP